MDEQPPDLPPMTKTTESVSPAPLAEYLADARRRVDEALERYLPVVDPTGRSDVPARLSEAMRYSVLGGGKRLRPLLALMAAEACGADPEAAMPSACALEMVHTYSLIHDDLPAMDDDDLRRGRPTCHKAFDEATAILAGDGLLTLAFEVDRPAHSARRGRRRVHAGAGRRRRTRRHGRVVRWPTFRPKPGTMATPLSSSRRSTAARPGALLKAALRMGAAVAGASDEETEALDQYGRAVGLAFQIIDDLLDVQGDETKLGKRVGKDSELGKWTYPRFLGVEGSRRKARAAGRGGHLGAGASRGSGGPAQAPWRGIYWKGTVDEQHRAATAAILPRIGSPADLKKLSDKELEQLAGEMRDELIDVVGRRAAHFASQPRRRRALPGPAPDLRLHRGPPDLGHRPPDLPAQADHRPRRRAAHDPHQGRPDGLPKPATRAPIDLFMTGHAGCAPSTALGLKAGDDLLGRTDRHSVAVIGDGAFPSGIVFEAMNNAAGRNRSSWSS